MATLFTIEDVVDIIYKTLGDEGQVYTSFRKSKKALLC